MRFKSSRSNCTHVEIGCAAQRVDIEIDQRAGGVFYRGEALVEGARRQQAVEQRLRHRLARARVAGVFLQDLRHLQPVLVELRRQFDEIARHRRAGKQRIGHVRQQPVQGVTEFVEQRAGVVERQQRRLTRRRLGEIADVEDDRTDVAAEFFLVAQRGHPGAGVLGAAREIIADEQADMTAGHVFHLEGARVRVIKRHIDGREAQAEQTPRGLEGGLHHLVELEIGLDLGLIQVEFGFAQLLGVIAPVPGLQARN